MRTNQLAVALNANPIAAHSAFECLHCGRVYDEPVPPDGCFSDDCPGHDPVDPLEAMQWEAEDELHRTRGRYMRSARANGRL